MSKSGKDGFLEHLNALKTERGLSDAGVARLIGLANRQYLAKIRAGEKAIPLEVKIRIWDLLGYPWSREVILSLLPESFVTRVRAVDSGEMEISKPPVLAT